MSVFKQNQVLACEGGEGGEASAQANHQEHPPFDSQDGTLFGDPDQEADQQASQHIYSKCADWDGEPVNAGVEPGNQKAGHASDKSSGTNQ